MGSGALWLASIALGMDAGLAMVCPSWLRAPYQYPRGSHASWATIITARDCCQSGMSSPGISGIPGYLGWPWLLGKAGEGAYLFSTIGSTGYLPLFRYAPNASR